MSLNIQEIRKDFPFFDNTNLAYLDNSATSQRPRQVVEAVMVVVKDNIVNGEDIFLRGFGTVTTKTRKQKIGRLIKENKSVVVPEHKIPSFKPSKAFTIDKA